MFLYLKGKCQPKQWKPDEWEIKVNTIELLPDVKDRLIEKLTVTAPLSAINDEMIMELGSMVKDSPEIPNYTSSSAMKTDKCLSTCFHAHED